MRGLMVVAVAVNLALVLGSTPSAPAEGRGPARTTHDQRAVDQAIERLTVRTRQHRDDPSGWTALGDAFMQKGRETADSAYYRRAELAFERARALDATDVSATVGLSQVHGARHEFEKSMEWARRALTLDARNAGAYGLLGDAALELGDYEAATDHYQQMLDIRPDISSYSRSAHLLFVTGDARRAVWLMERAIKAGAGYAENTAWCRAHLALIHLSTGNLLAAEQVVEQAIGLTPANYHVLFAQGRIRAARKDYAGAIESYRRASAIAPQHEVVVALGQLYVITGDRASADKQWAVVETLHKLNKANGVTGDLQLARLLADLDRRLPEALAIAQAEYQRRPNVYAADALAWTYYKNGLYGEAKRAIAKALAQRTPDAGFLFHAGMIHAKLGDRVTAQRYLARALSLNPSFHPLDAPVAEAMLAELAAQAVDTPDDEPRP
jgi:tetratricopeptide (TPR) repeat protein